MPKLKPDEKGRPRYLPARWIMKRDPDARMAYHALRRRGVSPQDAERAIERTAYEAFVEILIHEGNDWRDADRWFLLAEGLPVEKIFPKLLERHGAN
jgi:hypothetical protein